MFVENKIEKIRQLVTVFAGYVDIFDEEKIEKTVIEFSSMDIDDLFDKIILTLDSFVNRGLVTKEQILDNLNMILAIGNDKYESLEDLINRLKWLKSMNIVGASMSLSTNHRLVLEVFKKFNKLLDNNFDCYYTGGLMGYIATSKELERYHSDLDLFINESQLLELKDLVDKSEDFEFVSNMSVKDETGGHEYSIFYKGFNMSIGLFLFERSKEEVILKSYYNKDDLYVDERHLLKKYFELCFSDEIKFYNGVKYKMVSLENLYLSKYKGRPKDVYDANVIKDSVDFDKVNSIEDNQRYNYIVENKEVCNNVISELEKLLKMKGK